MFKIIGAILLLIIGFFVAGMFRPLLSDLVTIASNQTDSSNTFALALLATFGIGAIIWVFVRVFSSLREKD